MDSWYTTPSVLDSCQEKGYHLIGAIKTNRILLAGGKRVSAFDLAASLAPDCFHPVMVKGRTYMVYRCEGPLNKIDHAVVLLSYPVAAMDRKCASGHFYAPIPPCFPVLSDTLPPSTSAFTSAEPLSSFLEFAHF